MPYVDASRREVFEPLVRDLEARIQTPGDLNYVISRLLALLAAQNGGPSYHELSRWRAAVTDASDEFYRRVMATYEDRKMVENGDVYVIHK